MELLINCRRLLGLIKLPNTVLFDRAARGKYQQAIEKAGGIYYIAKDFDSFYEWYNKMFAV